MGEEPAMPNDGVDNGPVIQGVNTMGTQGAELTGTSWFQKNFPRERLEALQKTLTGDAADLSTQLVNQVSSNATVASFLGYTVSQTTQSIISATNVFNNPESSQQEKAASVLGVFASFSAVLGAFGPAGVAAGTIISGVLSVITMILNGTAEHREDELDKLERRLRELNAEDAANDVQAARDSFSLALAALESLGDGTRSWADEKDSTTGISHFALAKTSAWLQTKANQGTEKWEEVFVGYAEATLQVITLLNMILLKLKPAERAPMLAYMKVYGGHIERNFGAMRDTVARCGEYYAIDINRHGWYDVKNPWQPPGRPNGGWQSHLRVFAQSIAISRRNDRIWAGVPDRERPLVTGSTRAGLSVHVLENHGATGCVDVCLWPWVAADTDLLLACVTKPNPLCTGDLPVLIVNEWTERRSRFYTQNELSKGTTNGFAREWWKPTNVLPGVVMVRGLGGPPAHRWEDRDYLYLVRKKQESSQMLYSLSYLSISELRRDIQPRNIPAELPLPIDGSIRGMRYVNTPFRISVTRRFIYVYTHRAAWRSTHEDLLAAAKSQSPPDIHTLWKGVTLPADRMGNPGEPNPVPEASSWWSNGLNDLDARSDNDVTAVLGQGGELWTGNYDPARETHWQDFDVLIQTDGTIAEGGQSLIVIARIGQRLHLRVFDETGARVADADQAALPTWAIEFFSKLAPSPALQLVDDQVKRDLNQAIAPVAGVGWRWTQLPGGGFRLIKRKNASFDYCEALIKAGKNLRTSPTVGRT